MKPFTANMISFDTVHRTILIRYQQDTIKGWKKIVGSDKKEDKEEPKNGVAKN